MGRPLEPEPRPETRFVVERYAPGVSVADVRAGERRLRRAIAKSAADGRSIRYLGSIVIDAEDTVIAVFEARSLEDVSDVQIAARVGFDRIVPAVELRESERPALARYASEGDAS